MKKLFLIFVSIALCNILLFTNICLAESYQKIFNISAYYSPLPCQNNYATGSYEGDIRLNGRGTNGADGTQVYPGMLAAPQVYPFGTKIHIPGLGTGTVHDRGGAIVASNGGDGVYDRLDVWMGYGDVGLARALNWGKRVVETTVYGVDPSISDNLYLASFSTYESAPNHCLPQITGLKPSASSSDSPSNDLNVSPPVPEFVTDSALPDNPATFSSAPDSILEFGMSGRDVRVLQEELSLLNFYKYDITGYYGDLTRHAVYKFQQSQFLVGDFDSPGAGVFGPKTREKLMYIVSTREYNQNLIAEANSTSDKSIHLGASPKSDIASAVSHASNGAVLLSSELEFGISSYEVKKLQTFLASEGYFRGILTTDYFGDSTKASVINFQLENGIILDSNDAGAGRVGPKTLSLINSMS